MSKRGINHAEHTHSDNQSQASPVDQARSELHSHDVNTPLFFSNRQHSERRHDLVADVSPHFRLARQVCRFTNLSSAAESKLRIAEVVVHNDLTVIAASRVTTTGRGSRKSAGAKTKRATIGIAIVAPQMFGL